MKLDVVLNWIMVHLKRNNSDVIINCPSMEYIECFKNILRRDHSDSWIITSEQRFIHRKIPERTVCLEPRERSFVGKYFVIIGKNKKMSNSVRNTVDGSEILQVSFLSGIEGSYTTNGVLTHQ